MLDINFFAVIAAAVSSFLVGGLWYSPLLFGKKWMVESGFDETKAGPSLKVFGLSFLYALFAALIFSLLLGPNPTMAKAIEFATLVSIGLIVTSFGINYQFSNKSAMLLLIDGGYHTAQFLLYGVILATWQ
ncbi:DUF1761 domain-containing protein [Colwellia sp. MEBiC06753]